MPKEASELDDVLARKAMVLQASARQLQQQARPNAQVRAAAFLGVHADAAVSGGGLAPRWADVDFDEVRVSFAENFNGVKKDLKEQV